MADDFFETQKPFVEVKLMPGETIEDIEAMYSIITEARRERKPSRKEDKRIGLWSLCFLGVPYKSPRFSDGAQRFRATFRGIAVENSQQKRFRECLKPSLLDADSVDDLEGTKFGELFDESGGYAKISDPPDSTPAAGGGKGGFEGIIEVKVEKSTTRSAQAQPDFLAQ